MNAKNNLIIILVVIYIISIFAGVIYFRTTNLTYKQLKDALTTSRTENNNLRKLVEQSESIIRRENEVIRREKELNTREREYNITTKTIYRELGTIIKESNNDIQAIEKLIILIENLEHGITNR